MDSAAAEISEAQSIHSHADIILCSFYIFGALFRRVNVTYVNYLLLFRNNNVRKCLEHPVQTRLSDMWASLFIVHYIRTYSEARVLEDPFRTRPWLHMRSQNCWKVSMVSLLLEACTRSGQPDELACGKCWLALKRTSQKKWFSSVDVLENLK